MTTDNSQNSIDEQLLAAILDRLIPAVGDLPAAGQMGLTSEIVRLSGQQARFSQLFQDAVTTFASTNPGFIALAGDDQDDALRLFEASSPELFGTLRTISYIVYYKDERVHRRIGWSGQTPQPEGNEMEPWDESVLENIRKREPFWRQVH